MQADASGRAKWTMAKPQHRGDAGGLRAAYLIPLAAALGLALVGCSDSAAGPKLGFLNEDSLALDGSGGGRVDVAAGDSPSDDAGPADVGLADAGADAQGMCASDEACAALLDAGPCQAARCTSTGQCELAPAEDGASCDDGDPCTSGDACLGGQCVGGDNVCACTVDADCAAFEDGDACNGTLVCGSGGCEVDPSTVVTCDGFAPGVCQGSACDPATGACVPAPAPDGAPCDDGDACTAQDSCQQGVCQAGPSLGCPDQGPCATVSCDPAVGCVAEPVVDGTACSDMNPCTAGDSCQGAVCVGGANSCQCQADADCAPYDLDACDAPLVCAEGSCVPSPDGPPQCPPSDDPCQVSSCDPAAGCVVSQAPDGTACPSPDLCAPEATCQGGACVPGAQACDDGDPCTDDACDAVKGCVNLPNIAACDDGNPCTAGDACQGGACVGGVNTCQCESDGDCQALGLDPCLGAWECVANQCAPAPGTAVDCAGLGGPCQVAACDPATGQCAVTAVADGTSCDDGSACTEADACRGGACVGGAPTVCDDGNPCTDDACDAASGCSFTPNQAPCDDGSACTTGDVCAQGSCSGQALACPDAGPCSQGVCDPNAGCVQVIAADGATCDDGDDCTQGDTCQGGTCRGTSVCECVTSADCPDDGDACNGFPTCDAQGHCVVDPATIIICPDAAGGCGATTCDPASGQCVPTSVDGAPCDDSDPCTVSDACQGGLCVGQVSDCDDSNACTTDACDPPTGTCVHQPLDGTACDDGEPCTVGDSCAGGACVGGPVNACDDANACTVDSCVPGGQGCVHAPAQCDDGDPCTSDSCDPSAGCLTAPLVCPVPSGPCVVAVCDAAQGGCVEAPAPDGTSCDDGDACTSGDSCAAGVCAGAPLACDDGNACTTDSCFAGQCISVPDLNAVACDDGDPCTVNDACSMGACAGSPKDCSDGDPCTSDLCTDGQCSNPPMPGGCACVGQPGGTACDDGDPTTYADMCSLGVCAGFRRYSFSGTDTLGHVEYRHVNYGRDHWFAAGRSGGGTLPGSYGLAEIDDPLNTNTFVGSLQQNEYTDLYGGFAVDTGGILREFNGTGWVVGTPLPLALHDAGGGGAMQAVWSATIGGHHHVWTAGAWGDGTPAVFHCTQGACDTQGLEGNPPSDPRAMKGHLDCNGSGAGSCSPHLAMGADFYAGPNWQGDQYYNDVYENDGGDQGTWPFAFTDQGPSQSRTRDIASYGDGRYLVVGERGYLRFRDASGAWSQNLLFVSGQWNYTFTGALGGADLVVVSAHTGGANPTLQLWTCPLGADATDGNNWTTHTVEQVTGAGSALLDVWGLASGELRAVGTGNVQGGAGDPWRDGLIYVRQPQ